MESFQKLYEQTLGDNEPHSMQPELNTEGMFNSKYRQAIDIVTGLADSNEYPEDFTSQDAEYFENFANEYLKSW